MSPRSAPQANLCPRLEERHGGIGTACAAWAMACVSISAVGLIEELVQMCLVEFAGPPLECPHKGVRQGRPLHPAGGRTFVIPQYAKDVATTTQVTASATVDHPLNDIQDLLFGAPSRGLEQPYKMDRVVGRCNPQPEKMIVAPGNRLDLLARRQAMHLLPGRVVVRKLHQRPAWFRGGGFDIAHEFMREPAQRRGIHCPGQIGKGPAVFLRQRSERDCVGHRSEKLASQGPLEPCSRHALRRYCANLRPCSRHSGWPRQRRCGARLQRQPVSRIRGSISPDRLEFLWTPVARAGFPRRFAQQDLRVGTGQRQLPARTWASSWRGCLCFGAAVLVQDLLHQDGARRDLGHPAQRDGEEVGVVVSGPPMPSNWLRVSAFRTLAASLAIVAGGSKGPRLAAFRRRAIPCSTRRCPADRR